MGDKGKCPFCGNPNAVVIEIDDDLCTSCLKCGKMGIFERDK